MTETKVKTYTIGGKNYTQRTMVLGQIRHLTEAFGEVEIPPGANLSDIAVILGDRLPGCAAAVLQPEGVLHKDKDLDAMAAEFFENLDIDTANKVIDDFFDLTPSATLATLIGRLGGVLRTMMSRQATGSSSSSSPSPQETSPKETPSSGDTE